MLFFRTLIIAGLVFCLSGCAPNVAPYKVSNETSENTALDCQKIISDMNITEKKIQAARKHHTGFSKPDYSDNVKTGLYMLFFPPYALAVAGKYMILSPFAAYDNGWRAYNKELKENLEIQQNLLKTKCLPS